MSDLKIYQKASRAVKASLFFFCILYLGAVAGTWFLLNIDLFQTGTRTFQAELILLSFAQAIVFIFLFWLLSQGKKSARIYFWLGILANFALIYLPVSSYLDAPEHIYTWLAFAACLIIEDVLLYNVGMYLFQNHSCKIFFDKVVEIDEDDASWMQQQSESEPAGDTSSQEKQEKAEKQPGKTRTAAVHPETNRAAYPENSQPNTPPIPSAPSAKPSKRPNDLLSYKARMQKTAIQLGLVVYSELFIFPIVVSLLSDFFISSDMKTLFATRDIFILCMASAVIWTFALFILYYAPNYSKKAVIACWAAEAVVTLIYLPTFIGYYHSVSLTYPIQVFIFFIVLDLIRYVTIFFVSSPVFTRSPR